MEEATRKPHRWASWILLGAGLDFHPAMVKHRRQTGSRRTFVQEKFNRALSAFCKSADEPVWSSRTGTRPTINSSRRITYEKVGSTLRAESNGLAWQREPDEAEKDFQDRVVGDLGTAGHRPPFLIILYD